MAGVVLDKQVLDLVNGYRRGRGLNSSSAALRELVEYALGKNLHQKSAIEDYLPESSLKERLMRKLKKVFPDYRSGG